MKYTEEEGLQTVTPWVIRLMHGYSSINFKRFRDLGIHPGQLPVLRVVHEHEGLSLRELADQLHIKPPTVTVTVKRLEKAGLVCKRTDSEDMRIVRIYETEKGSILEKEIRSLSMESERIMTDGFSQEELELMCDFFRRMTDNLARAGADDTPCGPPL